MPKIADLVAGQAKKPAADVLKSEDLFTEGLIDSFGILDLLSQLETAFGVSVSNDDLTWQNFRSVEQMARLISSLRTS
jgi:methoxymalonate biosynthesis acyl carrier protein